MSITSLRRLCLFVCAGTLALAARSVIADPVPDGASDILVVQGFPATITVEFPAGTAGPEIGFIPVPGLIDPSQFGNPTYLSGAVGTLSDMYGIIRSPNSPGGFALGYLSDDEVAGFDILLASQLFGVDPQVIANAIPNAPLENPNGDDATKYLDPVLQAQGVTATFTSDSEVPEPVEAVRLAGLGGMGVIGLVLGRRRAAKVVR
jgi:hypothetical protein